MTILDPQHKVYRRISTDFCRVDKNIAKSLQASKLLSAFMKKKLQIIAEAYAIIFSDYFMKTILPSLS